MISPRMRALACTVAVLSTSYACGSKQGASTGGAVSNTGPAPAGPTWTLSSAMPYATTAPPYTSVQHPVPPSPKLWDSHFKAPFPTNRWFEDAALLQVDRVDTTYTYAPDPNYGDGEFPFSSFPYLIVLRAQGVSFALNPLTYVQRSPPGPYDPAHPTTIPGSIIVPSTETMQLGSVEALTSKLITAYDFLSCEVTYSAATGTIKVPLVEGMAYVTLAYGGLTPKLTGAVAFTAVNGSTVPGSVGPSNRFLIDNAMGQEWVLYASSPVTLAWSPTSLQASGPFQGVMRAALVSSPQSADGPFVVNNDVTVLDAHESAYPTGATVDAQIAGDKATVSFSWQTAGTGPLLMMSAPHHQGRLSGATSVSGVTYPTPTGMFQAAEGTEWTLTYELPTVAFAPPRPIVPAKVSQLESALANDTNVVYAQIAQSIADPYDAFRRYGAMARLAEIAEELGDSASAATARQLLEPWPSRWLESASVDNLVYDKSWGGVVVQGGLTTADDYYYNGYYNDHHFQYGYMIYAAALLAKPGTGDASWLAANGHQDAVTALVRDIANPSANDPYFPPLRYWDWYWGHSWTLGILHDGNGRDEESESEATNAWYAVSLYGQAIRNVDMQNVGRLLAGMEIVSAQTYWQIPQASTVYPEAWATIGVAPNPHSLMVDFETYFGVQDEYMYGIEALPFTPISEALINPQWIADRWQSRLEPRLSNGLDENWRAYLYMLEATADPATAQSLMASAPPQMYLWGNSETNTLWFLATRPH